MFSAAAGLVSLQERYSSDSNVALDRIESLAFNFIHDMMNERHEGAVQMLNRTYNNLMEHPESGALLFGDKITTRKLSARTARTVARMLEVVMTMQNLLLSGRRISQRELFYMLIGSFDTQAQLNKIILDVSAMLGVPRYALNIGAATRGVMAGNICIATSGSIYKVDCEHVGANGWPIPGDVLAATSVVVASTARYILVIEKFGIFTRLVQDRFYDSLPCILICGKGYPSVSTRALTCVLESRLRIPVLGLADFNPDGAALLQCYRRGGVNSSMEGCRFVCKLRWLGLRSCHIRKNWIIGGSGEPLTVRDKAIIRGLQRNHAVFRTNDGFKRELDAMNELGKYELQWLYGYSMGSDFLTHFLVEAILHGDYL